MIDSFVESWELFGGMYLAGLGCAVLLSVVGIYLVARHQVFVGVAVSQASILGVAASLLWHCNAHLMAILFSMITCFVLVVSDLKNSQKGSERIVAWIFLLCMSLSVILVSSSPHSLESVTSLMSSGLIQTTEKEAVLFWALSILVLGLIKVFYKKIILIMTDIEMARVVGLNVTLWIFLISLLLGLSIGVTAQSVGMLFSVSCLVLPAMAARNFCKKTSSVFIVTPFIALLGVLSSFVFANHYDLPLDQMACIFLCGVVLMSWLFNIRF